MLTAEIQNMTFSLEQSAEYRFAKESVDEYVDAVMRDHYDAEKCWECEALLSRAISSYTWLSRLEEMVRTAAYEGRIKWDDQLEDCLRFLYKRWLTPCDRADSEISEVARLGHRPDNLEQFEEVRAKVQDRLGRADLRKIAKKSRRTRSNAEPW